MNKIKLLKSTRWLLAVALVAIVAIPASALYIQTLNPGAASEEAHTTSIRVYGFLEEIFLLDIEHRIYPTPIEVSSGSEVTLTLIYEVEVTDLETIVVIPFFGVEPEPAFPPELWIAWGHMGTEVSVEVPRMPSECSIQTTLEVPEPPTDEFAVIATFTNPTGDPWRVGRPLVKVYAILVVTTVSWEPFMFPSVSVTVTVEIS